MPKKNRPDYQPDNTTDVHKALGITPEEANMILEGCRETARAFIDSTKTAQAAMKFERIIKRIDDPRLLAIMFTQVIQAFTQIGHMKGIEQMLRDIMTQDNDNDSTPNGRTEH